MVDVRLTLMGELNVEKRTNAIAFSPPSWSRNHGNTNMTIILAESRRNEPDQNFLSWYCLCVVWGGGREEGGVCGVGGGGRGGGDAITVTHAGVGLRRR